MINHEASVSEDMHSVAQRYIEAGLSIIPITPNGTKSPAWELLPYDEVEQKHKWKPFQTERANADDLRKWFGKGTRRGVAIIGGQISGNMEILDFDEIGIFEQWLRLCEDHDMDGLVKQLPHVLTPSGGHHLYYRCVDPVEGSQKLALTTAKEVRIETKSEGGYVLAPPTPPACHPDKKPYVFVSGSIATMPKITGEERSGLLAMARMLNEFVEPERPPLRPSRTTPSSSGMRPGDDYNERGDYESILERHGWTRLRTGHSGETSWRRPGKADKGLSATTNYDGSRKFKSFSSNCSPFEQNRFYDAFGVFCHLEHGGDIKAATKALAAMGYGSALPPRQPAPRAIPQAKVPAVSHDIPGDPPVYEDDFPPFVDDSDIAQSLIDHVNADVLEGEGTRGPSDAQLATEWALMNKSKFAYVEGDQYWQYESGRWRYSSHEIAQRSVMEFLEKKKKDGEKVTVSQAKVKGILFLARLKIGPVPMSKFDAHPEWINMRNGVFDTTKGILIPHDAAYYLSHQVPFNYDATADCPSWRAFMLQVLIDSHGNTLFEWLNVMQQFYGLCLIPSANVQVAMFWVGSGGNGKGAATRCLENLVGREFCVPIPVEQLHDPYHRAELHGKRVGLVNEPDPKAMAKNGNHFKAITGGDSISARRPTEKVFSFTFQGKIILSCNELPSTRDFSNGYFRRIILIDWRYNVPEKLRDPDLDEKFRAELPGIFNWAIQGLTEFRNNGGRLTESPESKRLLEDYKTVERDGLATFIDECCIFTEDDQDRVSADSLYKGYVRWCKENGESVYSATSVGRRLSRMGYKSVPGKVKIPGENNWRSVKQWHKMKITGAESSLGFSEYEE